MGRVPSPPVSSFTHSTTTTADLATTWAALQQGATWEGLGGVEEVRNIVHAGDALRSFSFTAHAAGRDHPGEAMVRKSHAPELLVLDIATRDLGGSITTRLSPVDDGTQITVTITLEPKSMLVRLAFGAVQASVQNGMPRQVEEFATRIGG